VPAAAKTTTAMAATMIAGWERERGTSPLGFGVFMECSPGIVAVIGTAPVTTG
jgi:hypothetical protein